MQDATKRARAQHAELSDVHIKAVDAARERYEAEKTAKP